MRNAFIFILIGLILLATNALFAQDEETIKVDTTLITLGVSVRDTDGKYVKGLKKVQFQLLDDNKEQEISIFSMEETPISFGIVYDLHPTTSDRTKTILKSLEDFTKGLRDRDRFNITVFNENGSFTTDFIPTLEQVDKHLASKIKGKPNSLYDAIFLTSEKLQEQTNEKKALLIISDGNDHFSHHSYKSLRKKVNSFNVQIYAVILNDKEEWGFADINSENEPKIIDLEDSKLGQAAIEKLSSRSGGYAESQRFRNSANLSEIFKRINIEMQNQYLLGFYPQEIDDRKHDLNISIVREEKDKKLKLDYRKKYKPDVRIKIAKQKQK
ncbi:MAG: VWA domain-containing protein [Pyrinomonadaceae bacterium]|nr:VWA domain-containing protein [Pyrinomonadaceae bacterium]